MSDKLVEDLVKTVVEDDAFKRTSESLKDGERKEIEDGVRGFAELMAPFLRAVEALSQDDEALALARAKLSEKPTGG